MKCPKCKSDSCIKNGTLRNKQRFLCRLCNRQFIPANLKITEAKNIQKRHAIVLYLEGLNYREIAQRIRLNYKTVYNWLQKLEPLLKELRNTTKSEQMKMKELMQLIEVKSRMASYYGLLLIDTETGLSYVTH